MTLNVFRVLIGVGLVVTNLYVGGAWCYVLLRARCSFACIFALSNAAALLASIISLALVLDSPALQRGLGPEAYYFVYWFFLSLQPLVLLLNIIGVTILVRFLLRYESLSPAKA
jgi:hypothetical protein